MSEMFLFEHRYRHQVWRVQIATVNGKPTVSIWPWFNGKDGELHPGAARFGGGFQMPFDRLVELRDAIDAAIQSVR
jgi:hypothetical protein